MKLHQLIERLRGIVDKDPAMDDAECYITIEHTENGVTTQYEKDLEDVAAIFPNPHKLGRNGEVQLLGPGI